MPKSKRLLRLRGCNRPLFHILKGVHMALKHLVNALELLHAGMSISDIKGIIALPNEEVVEPEENQNETEPEPEENQDETLPEPEENQDETPPEPAKKEEPKKNPYQEKSQNVTTQETLIKELNSLF